MDVVAAALGGEMVTTTVEGRERFGVTVRYPRDLRSDPQAIAREVLVPVQAEMGAGGHHGAARPTGRGQDQPPAPRPSAPKTRCSRPTSMSISATATSAPTLPRRRKAVNEQVKFTPGTYVTWSGQFEYMERAIAKLKVVVPVTLLIIFLLLYLNFRRITETLIVMLSVPFALVGGIWLMWLLGYNLSVAAAIGFIALAGVAAETGVVMLIYLDHAWRCVQAKCAAEGRRPLTADLYAADHGRRRRTGAPEDDDRHRHHGRPAAHPVGHRYRFRSDEPDRRADGRRHDLIDRADAGRDSGDLRAGEATLRWCLKKLRSLTVVSIRNTRENLS
jgi:Cu(I)/Ag(I) efflux system membrane protein CusA/SilA